MFYCFNYSFTAKKDTPFENNSNKVSAVNNNHRTFKNTSNNQSIDKKESAPRYLYSRGDVYRMLFLHK